MASAFIIFLVFVLFLLAITDLIVGVSNDAVNFLNSAIGSKVASFRTIIIIASLGVVLGAMFSSGIMEIARKGIFNPEHFTFEKLLLVFTAVMLTDIILLDVFNTLGLPTSTTVSIIFELLGAASVAGLLLSVEKGESLQEITKYINASGVTTIIGGIFLSIIIAFTLGVLVQYLSRLLFSFQYEQRLPAFGAFFAGIGITVILHFLLIKGLKGTTLITAEAQIFIQHNTWRLLGAIFLATTTLCWVLQQWMRINPLKIVVLLGTFALAMAFAGNDLVNFIGVPITGFLAYTDWKVSGVASNAYYENYLAGNDVVVPWYMLLGAGIIMSLTLWFSSKARKVTETEVKLGSQHEGEERFQPNAVSRSIVKTSMLLGKTFRVILPANLLRYYDISFKKSKMRQATIVHDNPAFDLVRASINLVLASAIIALATSYKLPLSTTYVSFMVAMGSSLADKAWGRETAVYRVAGVLSVIGGWFITAVIAFGCAALFVFIMIKGGAIGTLLLIALTAAYIVFSHWHFARKAKMHASDKTKIRMLDAGALDMLATSRDITVGSLRDLSMLYRQLIASMCQYDEISAAKAYKDLLALNDYSFTMKATAIRSIRDTNTENQAVAQMLLYSTDLIDDNFKSLTVMGEEISHYIQNLHAPPAPSVVSQAEDLDIRMHAFIQTVANAIENEKFANTEMVKKARDDVRGFVNKQLDTTLRYIRNQQPETREAILHTTVLLQSRDMVAVCYRIYNLYRKLLANKSLQ